MARLGTIAAALASSLVGASAAGNHWSVITQNIGTFSTGVSFNADGKTGFLAVGANSVGAQILKTTNGGKSWAATNDAPELMVLDVTSSGNDVQTIGTLVGEYSSDLGNDFETSKFSSGSGVGQCIRNLGPHDSPLGAAIVGQFGLINQADGIAVSNDGGKTYTVNNITTLYTDSRYGAFPTATTWYVSAGTWPSSGSDDNGSGSDVLPELHPITGKVSVHSTDAGLRYNLKGASSAVSQNGYQAQLIKTTDAGATWTSLFLRNNWAYFNGIDCLDANRCCVGAENDDANGFSTIMCTWDGGLHWNQTYFNNATGSSILDLRVVGTDGYWAVGGVISQTGSAAGFLYSADAGLTWTLDTVIDGVYASSVDCAQGTQECWATLLDATTQEASVAYASTV